MAKKHETPVSNEDLRKMVHKGISLEPPVPEVEVASVEEITVPVERPPEPIRAKRKPRNDYQNRFFTRVDFSHRKPLYITATTHRRLMRIVHCMDESKATISSYVENIILNHLETFKEDVNHIYQTNNINPSE